MSALVKREPREMALLRPARASALLLALLAACAATASGYYLPGTFPQAYDVGAKLQGEAGSALWRT